MAFLSCPRLFGILLIAASLPMDPGIALATGMAASPASPGAGEHEPTEAIELRLRRIGAAMRQRSGEEGPGSLPDDVVAGVFVNVGPVGWRNGGWGNGGFYNGGFRNGGFSNGGFWNGGFRNGGFHNGGFRNGGFYNRW
ncbi:MAG: GrrA/OscA1 family cyclophane-containing rSAM-modified RiPP [Cyanobium sp.]